MGRKLKYIFFISCGVSMLIGLFIPHEHVHFGGRRLVSLMHYLDFLAAL